MTITEARVTRIDGPHLKALISLVIDDLFAIHEFRVVEVDGALDVVMPLIWGRGGRPYECVLPANPGLRELIRDVILHIYLNGEGAEAIPIHAPLVPKPPVLSATAARILPVPTRTADAVDWPRISA
jgi:DNA-binding cell septation regulator SpoVG